MRIEIIFALTIPTFQTAIYINVKTLEKRLKEIKCIKQKTVSIFFNKDNGSPKHPNFYIFLFFLYRNLRTYRNVYHKKRDILRELNKIAVE